VSEGHEHCVLIVEDDEAIRDTLRDVLETEGYRVESAANGREGLDMLEHTSRPCLVLLDLMMPVMSGGEFLAAIRASDETADLPVIVVTAWPDEASRVAAAAQGYVKKPISLEVLLENVARFCRS
jgi:CheY-like chemotaxis protein